MSKVDKFNIHWQIVRVNARSIKNICEKIEYVMDQYIISIWNAFGRGK